ncbi:MAG: hypothetical protein KIT22_12750, partial [Verrucomicrobiae bacterium]|nr:hypothetical protein [Verrucomicrobiae bacterium]
MKSHINRTTLRCPASGLRASMVLTGLTAALSASAAGVFDINLIQNPGAEDSLGSSDGSFSPPAAWTVVGDFTAVQYGAPGDFPDASSSGSPTRGLNFFAGGPDNGFSWAGQWIDVTAGASLIDTGTVQYSLSGWLGGWQNQNDNLTVTVRFYDAGNQELGNASIGSVFAADRSNATSFLFREDLGWVPTDTRSIQVL